jgi:pimeloyl-ACP methyl ester carboxylesterase
VGCMPVVFVHGNPETAAVWGPLVAELGRGGAMRTDDLVRLSPPGWGAPAPAGWGATLEEYRQWLVGELEGIGEPVDLVGHDWGGGHVANVAMTRPDLLRSWCSDALGVFDPDYVWHDLAQLWQTPGAGEASVEAMVTQPAARTEGLVALGLTPQVAREIATGWDATMGRCMLALYRDAAQPAMARLGEHLEAAAVCPGLSVQPSDDHFVGTDEMRRRAAARAGARVVPLDGVGHWWMVQDPARGAAVLTDFWASLPR